MEQSMPYIWLAVIVIMSVIEAATAQFVSIWFVVGGIAALVTSIFTPSVLIQLIVFIAVTLLTLLLTRPFVKRVLHFKKEDTNVGRYIGKKGIVIEEINNEIGVGQINVSGSVWTARSSNGTVVPKGEEVQVQAIEGVKLIVKVAEE